MRIILLTFLILNFNLSLLAKDNAIIENTQQIEEFNDDFSDEYGEEKIVFDPLEGYNRAMTNFNDGFYIYAFKPVVTTYADILHRDIRVGIDNVFKNLFFPIRFVNNVLQGKLLNASEETGRFVVNSTLGLFGIFDVAKKGLGWQAHREDFGQTLGFYGVPAGPHIVLPFFGPSNMRDSVGFLADGYFSPTTEVSSLNYKIPDTHWQGFFLTTGYYLNTNSLVLGQYEAFKEDSIDLYTLLRNYYEEKREQEIKE